MKKQEKEFQKQLKIACESLTICWYLADWACEDIDKALEIINALTTKKKKRKM